MEDLPFMPIMRELFDTLPEWDVPELNLDPGATYFFRDSDAVQIVRYRDGIIKRYAAEFVRPRTYETSTDWKSRSEAVFQELQDDIEKEMYAVPPAELPEMEIDESIWEILPRERRNTGGYWRDDDILYCQMLAETDVKKFRPRIMIKPAEPVANAQDGTDVVAESPLQTYAINRVDFDALPEWTADKTASLSTGLFRDGNQVVRYIGSREERFIADFGEIPF